MIWRALALLLLLASPAAAQVGNVGGPSYGFSAGPPACVTAANNYLSRNTGAPNATAITTLVCAMISDGLITGDLSGASGCGSKFDAIYILASDTEADARFNLCGTANPAVQHGYPATLSFTADQGFSTADTSGGSYLDVATALSSLTNYQLDSAHFSVWSLTNVAGIAGYMGSAEQAGSGTAALRLLPRYTDNNTYCSVNDADVDQTTATTINSTAGFFVCNRLDHTTQEIYHNGTLAATASHAATGVPTLTPDIMAVNAAGVHGVPLVNVIFAFATIGAGLSATDVANMQTDVCAYLTTVHGSC
jgi:hypothetical protein